MMKLSWKILQFCKEYKMAAEHVIPDKPFRFTFIPSLTPPDERQLENAFNEIIELGYFESPVNHKSFSDIRLTESGEAFIYSEKFDYLEHASTNSVSVSALQEPVQTQSTTDNTQTLVEKYLSNIKNNRIVAILVVLGIAIIALANFGDAITKIKSYWTPPAVQPRDNARPESDIGAVYYLDRHVIYEPNKAQELLLKAQQDDPVALYDMGVMYRDGIGVPKNVDEAKYYFLYAAKLGDALAQYGLARIYYDESDFVRAAYWYAKAGDQGDLEAIFNLGLLYYNGQGVAKDYGKANEQFLRAAIKGRSDTDGRTSRALDMLVT